MAADDVTAVPAVRSDFYVYVLFRENGVPFYVGKGQRDRWLMHERSARYGQKGHRASIIRKMQRHGIAVPKIKLHEGLTEAAAHAYEVALIAAIGRRPIGPLVNLTSGGEGASDPDPETVAKRSAKLRGRKHAPARIAKVAAALRGRTLSPQHAAKLNNPVSHAKSGATRRGRKMPLEAVEKSAAKQRGKPKPNAGNYWRGRKQPREMVAKRTAGQRGRKMSLETIEKSAAKRRGQKRPGVSAKLRGRPSPHRGKKLSAASIAKRTATRARNRMSRAAAAQLSLPFLEAAD